MKRWVAFFFLTYHDPHEGSNAPSVRRAVAVGSQCLSLDSIANASTFFAGKWEPKLKRNQSRDILTHLIGKLYYGVESTSSRKPG